MPKRVAILGSTGSIGKNALSVIETLGGGFAVYALTAHSRADLLAEQARHYHPTVVAITDSSKYKKLCDLLIGTNIEILSGADALEEIACRQEVDTVITAIVGAAGLPAVFAAAKAGKRLAIANKEPLVVAGELLMKTARENGAEVLPVDSEHSAIFQAMQAGRKQDIDKIILTASGGPFRGASIEDIEKVTVKQALAHPTWNMGPKITIDSATMMNKALEVIEARWLFDISVDKIDVLIHPQSIVHSLVEFIDGSVIAQMGTPDMCVPIQYALTWPERCQSVRPKLNLGKLGTLTFEKPNSEVFRALELGFEVARTGGTSAAVFNAANEAAVEQFLAGKIKFTGIVELIELCLDKHKVKPERSLDQLLEADRWARQFVAEKTKTDSVRV